MTFYKASRSLGRNRFLALSPFLLLFASISIFAQTGATYYVAANGSDSNPGTRASAWLTIHHAANKAKAGARVYVMAGVYNQIVSFPHSGTASAPITFMSYPGQTAVIDGTGLTVSNANPQFVDLEDTPPNFDTNPDSPAVGAGSTTSAVLAMARPEIEREAHAAGEDLRSTGKY